MLSLYNGFYKLSNVKNLYFIISFPNNSKKYFELFYTNVKKVKIFKL